MIDCSFTNYSLLNLVVMDKKKTKRKQTLMKVYSSKKVRMVKKRKYSVSGLIKFIYSLLC